MARPVPTAHNDMRNISEHYGLSITDVTKFPCLAGPAGHRLIMSESRPPLALVLPNVAICLSA